MTSDEASRYESRYHVRRCEKCCGNCCWFERHHGDCGCRNPKQAEFDAVEMSRSEDPWHIQEDYGAYGSGIFVDEGFICDLWKTQ